MLRKTTLIVALAMSTTAQAECYVRSAVTNQTTMSITSIADVEPLVVPISATHQKCIVNFRAQVNGNWITAEGERTGPKTMSERELCAGAVDSGRIQILSRANGANLTVEQNMVCNDRPEIKVKTVKRGEMVRESEVRPHPHFPKPFVYRTAQCRWFIEPEVHPGRDLLQRQGIICQVNGNEWQVVDKW
jgi:hypothetical protein